MSDRLSDRLYLYEHVPEGDSLRAWLSAEYCAPQDAALAIAVAEWGGLRVNDPADSRCSPLPGGGRVYWLGGCGAMVSTVPLPWLPESSRRGTITLSGTGTR